MEIESSPVEIDQLRRGVDRMKMEELALERETDEASRDRLERLRADLADKEEELRGLEARWEREKAALEGSGELRKQIDELRVEAERLQRAGDLGAASEILYGRIPALEKQIEAAESADAIEDPMVNEKVGPAGDRRGRRGLDRHPDRPAARGRDRQAAADGGDHRSSGWSASGPR